VTDSVIQGITDYIMTCPLLKDGVLRVDAIGDQAIEYLIETSIFDPVIKQYVNGDAEMQYLFSFGSREFYGMDRLQNIQNSAFYETFADWIRSNNRKQIYPDMPDKCYPEDIEVLSPGYLFDGSARNARYTIQLRLTYYKEV